MRLAAIGASSDISSMAIGFGPVLVVAAAAEHRREHRHLGDEADRRGDGRGHRADQDVAVLHVHQLVGHDGLDLGGWHRLQQARGGAHHGVLGPRPVANALG